MILKKKKCSIQIHTEGSPDPKQNSKLASVIAQVKEAKLPMGSIDRAIQNYQVNAFTF